MALVLAIAVFSVIGLGVGAAHFGSGAPATPLTSHATTPAVTAPSRTATETTSQLAHQSLEKTLAALQHNPKAPRDSILPPTLNPGSHMVGDTVSQLYNIAPAPIGIGDWGVENTSGTPTPYVLQSTSWQGTVTFNTANPFNLNAEQEFGVQLNTVTTNTTVAANTTNTFWTQNVMFYTPALSEIQFLDNVWNFSTPTFVEPAGTFYTANGTDVASSYYYDYGPALIVPTPFTAHLYINTSITNSTGTTVVNGVTLPAGGYSTVTFGYNVISGGVSVSHGIYDTVVFNSTEPKGSVPLTKFMVNGGKVTNTGYLLYDAEIMIGGPGGGTTVSMQGLTGSEQLQYLNGATSKYANAPSAWSTGTDTGETSEGISEAYSTAGTVELSAGPSIPVPLWNATPSGNIGVADVSGTISPANGFLFVNGGATYNSEVSGWTPIAPSGAFNFVAPPGTYSWSAMMSNYDAKTGTSTWAAGANPASVIDLTANSAKGIYTPLYAWNNSMLANLSSSGAGTPASPYVIFNNPSPTGLSSEFGEFNDFLYPVFPGILIANTTDNVLMENMPVLSLTYNPLYDAVLGHFDLPLTNSLQTQVYDASNVVLTNSTVTGWFFADDYGPYYLLPISEAIFWGDTDCIISDNTFVDQGTGLLMMDGLTPGGYNGVWGNNFVNATDLSPAFLYTADPVGIWEFESGDLIYDNFVDTTITAAEFNVNIYSGAAQVNLDNWNLTGGAPASPELQHLLGAHPGAQPPSVIGCGNFWADYTVGSALPYDEFGFIETGGDYCPSPISSTTHGVDFTPTGLSGSATWSVTLTFTPSPTLIPPQTVSSTGGITAVLLTGAYQYTVTAPAGYVAYPSSGLLQMSDYGLNVAITFVPATNYLVAFTETGLAPGTSWTVTLASTPQSSTGTEITFSEPNGAYAYTVGAVAHYTAAPASGTATVSGGTASEPIVFTPADGYLNGTVAPGSATVTIDGTAVTVSSGSFSAKLAPGTYAIVATASGSAPYYNNVTVSAGTGTSVKISLTSISTTTSSALSSAETYGIVGAIIVLAIAIIIAAALMRSRKQPPAQAWNQQSQSGSPPSNPPSS